MRIASIVPKPESQWLEPTLVLDVVLAFKYGQRIPLDLAVVVRTEDKRVLGVARPTNMAGSGALNFDAGEFGHGTDFLMPVQVALELSARHLDHLEGLRSKHRKSDVVLQCECEIVFFTSKTTTAYLHPVDDRASGEATPVVYKNHSSRDPFHSHLTNMWVLSADGGRTFIQRETVRQTHPVTISSSDWVHEYAAPWRATRYIVIELPQPEILTSTPNVEQRVNAAIEAAKKATESLSKGEWNDVIEALRPVWELLRNDADINDLLLRDGYPPDAVAAFGASVKAQFELASKFIHRTDKSGKNVSPELRASKEDSLVCYSFAMSLLNLVSRKAARLSP